MIEVRKSILIVGGGPVGLSLALLLDYWRVPCTIVNTGTEARKSPKGNTNNARTLEIFRQIGFIDDIRALGLPRDHPCDACFFTRLSKHEIYRHHMSSKNERLKMRHEAPATDQYVEPMLRANHKYVEECLFEKVRGSQLVDMRLGYEAKGFSQTEIDVTVTAVRLADGQRFAFTAEYVVDCSGGRSIIRKGLDIRYAGETQEDDIFMAGQFLNAWIRIPDLYTVAPALKTVWFALTINADKDTRGILATMNGKDESVLITKAGHKEKTYTPDDVVNMIRKNGRRRQDLDRGPRPCFLESGRCESGQPIQAVRIFLAGDSAHLFTPVGGFGMNTGVDDVHNLAWKLAAKYHGWGGSKLLDSYEKERKPIGFRNTSTSHRSAGGWHEPIITDALERDGPEGDKARARMARQSYVTNMHFCVREEDDFTGIQLGSRYDGSPLIVRDGKPPVDSWPETLATYTPSGVPGGRLPHLWLQAEHVFGASIFDRLGKGFTLVRVGAPQIDMSALQSPAATRQVPLKVLDVDNVDAFSSYEKRLMLVRPDHYIAWRGDQLPHDCGALLDQVCGFEGK